MLEREKKMYSCRFWLVFFLPEEHNTQQQQQPSKQSNLATDPIFLSYLWYSIIVLGTMLSLASMLVQKYQQLSCRSNEITTW